MNLLDHRRFRAAYDFMLLQAEVGLVDSEMARVLDRRPGPVGGSERAESFEMQATSPARSRRPRRRGRRRKKTAQRLSARVTRHRARAGVPAYVGLGSNLQGPGRAARKPRLEHSRRLTGRDWLASSASSIDRRPFGGIEQPDYRQRSGGIADRRWSRKGTCSRAAGRSSTASRASEPDGVRWGPRVLDLDLLVFSPTESIDEPGLVGPASGHCRAKFCIVAANGNRAGPRGFRVIGSAWRRSPG